MRTHGTLCFALIVSGLASCSSSGALPRAAPAPVNGRLVVLRDEPQLRSRALLDVLQSRLPVVVQHGRFSTADGITNICVQGRRSIGLGAHAIDGISGMPVCTMSVTYVNRVRVSDVGRFLSSARADEFDSMELLSATEALQRYGLSGDGGDVIVLWSRAR